jgi:hypothetical protein
MVQKASEWSLNHNPNIRHESSEVNGPWTVPGLAQDLIVFHRPVEKPVENSSNCGKLFFHRHTVLETHTTCGKLFFHRQFTYCHLGPRVVLHSSVYFLITFEF